MDLSYACRIPIIHILECLFSPLLLLFPFSRFDVPRVFALSHGSHSFALHTRSLTSSHSLKPLLNIPTSYHSLLHAQDTKVNL